MAVQAPEARYHGQQHSNCLALFSTHLALLSIMTLGRTGGGGTGSTLMMNQSGREYCTLKPSALQSSSLMPFRIL